MVKLATSVGTSTLLGWPSDTFSIDVVSSEPQNSVHTCLIFTPGNPGLMEWYIPFFEQILRGLGTGYACRGVANACHSLDPDKADAAAAEASFTKNKAIPWSVDGQAMHKCAFLDQVLEEFEGGASSTTNNSTRRIRFIFVSHSIGCHFMQRMVMYRKDILDRTILAIYLMPYIRMKAPRDKQVLLDHAAAAPNTVIAITERIMRVLKSLPLSTVDGLLKDSMNDDEGRDVAARLLRLPCYARNFFMLGTEEIRDVPEEFDVCAFRAVGRQCPIVMLFAGNDHWSPKFHMDDIQELQTKQIIPPGIQVTYKPQLQHDFVSDKHQVPIVVQHCLSAILAVEGRENGTTTMTELRSRL